MILGSVVVVVFVFFLLVQMSRNALRDIPKNGCGGDYLGRGYTIFL